MMGWGVACPAWALGLRGINLAGVSAVREEALTIIFLSKEAPNLLSSLLGGIFIIWKVFHILRIDHFENRLQQIKRNNT